jgi:hypothetical protein
MKIVMNRQTYVDERRFGIDTDDVKCVDLLSEHGGHE